MESTDSVWNGHDDYILKRLYNTLQNPTLANQEALNKWWRNAAIKEEAANNRRLPF